MSITNRKFMRLIVFFDLPVKTKAQRKVYTRFRKFLLRDGYDMVQYSVYARIMNGNDFLEKHIKRLKSNLPQEGSVRALQVTEKQYTKIKILVGSQKPQEKAVTSQQILLF